MPIFCTYFDRHYLSRGLALHESLRQHCPDVTLWILCLDEFSYNYLAKLNLPSTNLVSLDALERAFPCLRKVKDGRSPIEYYFTCTPFITKYTAERSPDGSIITYLDADTYFFASPAPIFAELEQKSIGIIEHRYPEWLHQTKAPYGLYNVGWVSFRRDEQGMACLDLWCEDCLNYCSDEPDGNRYADQKYLECWPLLFHDVCVIQHKGANVAPWNLMNYRFHKRSTGVYVDEQPLIFFHFHGFKQKTPWLYDTNTSHYQAIPSKTVRKAVFEPYIRAITRLQDNGTALSSGIRSQRSTNGEYSLVKSIHRTWRVIRTVVYGQQVIYLNKKVIF